MIFIYNFGSKSKSLSSQSGICPHCGRMCRFDVFLKYSYFSVFFIPLFKWNKKYYATSSCCGAIYSILPEVGKDINKGLITSIDESDMEYVSGSSYTENNFCTYCGAPRNGNNYCAKCGNKF